MSCPWGSHFHFKLAPVHKKEGAQNEGHRQRIKASQRHEGNGERGPQRPLQAGSRPLSNRSRGPRPALGPADMGPGEGHCLPPGGLFWGCPTKLHRSQPRGTETQRSGFVVADRCCTGTWTHIPVLHDEIENRVYWWEIYKQRDSGVPSCRCPIAGQQAPWPAWQERGGLRRALPLQLQHGLQHERKKLAVEAVAQLASSCLWSSWLRSACFSSDLLGQPSATLPDGRRDGPPLPSGPASPPASDKCGRSRTQTSWASRVCPRPASHGHPGWLPLPGMTPAMGTADPGFKWEDSKERNSDRACSEASALACLLPRGMAAAQPHVANGHKGPPCTCLENPWGGWSSAGQLSRKQQKLLQMCPRQTGPSSAKSHTLKTDGCLWLGAAQQRRVVFVERCCFRSFMGQDLAPGHTHLQAASSWHSCLPARRHHQSMAPGGPLRKREGHQYFGRVEESFCEARSNRVGKARGPGALGVSLTLAMHRVHPLELGGGWPHWDSLSCFVPSTFLITKKHIFIIKIQIWQK